MSKILIINGPNLNLLGEREQSQYGKENYKYLVDICVKKSEELKIDLDIKQSNIEGEIVDLIQEARNEKDGIIINAGGVLKTWDNKKVFDGGRIIACTNNKIFNQCRSILNKKTHLIDKIKWVFFILLHLKICC